MWTNYLKIAARNVRRHLGYASINVVGLAVGMACCILIGLYVQAEWSYDAFHQASDRIYRAWLQEEVHGDELVNTITPVPLGPRMKAEIPEVEQAVRLYAFTDLIRRGDTQFAQRIHVADAGFFEMFDFALRSGEPGQVLSEPGRVVLTESVAETYFADQDPVGQTVQIRLGDTLQPFTVSGVAADPPAPSSIQFDVLISGAHLSDLISEPARERWGNVYVETYVLAQEGTTPTRLAEQAETMVRGIFKDRYEPGAYVVNVQPITDIHLNNELPAGLEPVSDPAYSYVLAGIALLVLLIACINFMTLAVGRSADRAKEVGVRKAIGAQRRQLMAQFWGEAGFLTAVALLLSIVLAWVLLPFFNDLAGRALRLSLDATQVAGLVVLGGIVGVMAGSYPALVLSGFDPVAVFKNKLNVGVGKGWLMRGLVVVQFALSIMLIASLLTMSRQLDYLQSKNLGFDKEQVVVVPTTGGFGSGLAVYERLRSELASNARVQSLAAQAFAFDQPWATIGYEADDGAYREFRSNFVTFDFIETMDMEMADGRSFSRAISSDSTRSIIVNEAMVRALGWENAVGRRLPAPFPEHEIIGVVEDFNYASLHTVVEPLVLTMDPNLVLRGAANVMLPDFNPKIAIRLGAGPLRPAVEQVEQTWADVAPQQSFAYTFLDDMVDSQYRQEKRLSQIVRSASLLSVFIACLGLFGLAALAARQRKKEIGIRKTLGASVAGIVGLISKDFVQLVAVAFVLAVPVTYVAMQQWLADFAYRISMGVGVFLAAGALAALVALATVSTQALRAAWVDPVTALRHE